MLPEYFPLDEEKEVVKWINWYYDEYKCIPSDADIQQGLNGNEMLSALDNVLDADLQYAADVAVEFARTQAMKLAILASVDDVEQNKLANIRSRVEEALAVGCDRLDLGWELVADADQWVYDEKHGRRYPTGWPMVDAILGGGLVGGEYGLIMAPTGMGKTTALINIGCAMAGLVGAANVLHVTCEMPKQKVLKRYAIRVGARLNRDMPELRFRRMLEKKAASKLRARLRVADPVRKVEAIRRLIDNLAADGFETGALIVDYADRMIPARKRNDLRFELADITQDLRQLGIDYDMPVWSATQAGRQALYKEVVTVSDIAEAIEKATIADVIIALCQTRDEEKMGHGRLFMAKVRDAKGKGIIPIKLDFENQAITQRRKVYI